MADSPPASPPDSLRLFSPPVSRWFLARYRQPTDVQSRAWPRIAAGEHTLLTAPTGSGKTFAAFLWALDRLLTGKWTGGAPRVLYVSPLKALGNDIRRNLTEPMDELAREFESSGTTMARIRVESRTGDTPQEARRRMQRTPPEILITTPETLNILLTSAGGRRLLTGLECVILDEIHAVAAGKRGVHLITAVERLVRLSGEFQRIALSATVRPHDRIARWVAGWEIEGDVDNPVYRPRRMRVIEGSAPKKCQLQVTLPDAEPDDQRGEPNAFWASFGRQLRASIRGNRSTLIFGNARRTVEKIARFINEAAPEQIAYSHHGALSREIRTLVEERLKAGELKAIVATSSLELGIDVGSIDEVVMVQTPPSVASTLQRLGRSGHGVGETSRGRIMPLLGRDLLGAAVVARCVVEGEIEDLEPVTGALDVLAQVMLSMVAAEDWRVDELFNAIRGSDPYHDLPRRHFDLVLEMLAGRYATTRLRSLRPLVSTDRVEDSLRARPGADRLIYLSGGTIPDRGYYNLRIEGSGALLGELDEEFVWERSVGDTFTLGVQTWRVERITYNDVHVSPAQARSAMAPFWRAEELDRSSFVSERIAAFLEQLEPRLDEDELLEELKHSHQLHPSAGAALLEYLRRQREATGCLPHRHRLLVEHTAPPAGRSSHHQLVLHTLWGGRVNRPFAAALAAAWELKFGMRPEVVHSDDCVVVVHPATIELGDVFSLVPVASLEELLQRAVERTGFFGARFREAAGRALLLPRPGRGRRVPLWVHRQRSKELLEAVREFDDFPLVLEAWRTCLQDEFELESLRRRLDEVADGRVSIHHVTTDTPSPFTAQAAWKQTNELMYADDVPTAAAGARPELVREIALSSHLRPRIDPLLADDLKKRLHRLAPGWSPGDAADLLDWVKERLLIPKTEWEPLLDAMFRDHEADTRAMRGHLADRVVIIKPSQPDGNATVCAVENIPRIERALGELIADDRMGPLVEGVSVDDALSALGRIRSSSSSDDNISNLSNLVGEWLRFYPPVVPEYVCAALGIDRPRLDSALEELEDERIIVIDELTDGATAPEICDLVNLERLLRMARAEARPSLEPLPARAFPLALAEHQHVGLRDTVPEDLQRAIEGLFGFALPVELWETEILPARLDPYNPAWLDGLISESDLRWIGHGRRRILFALDGERDLCGTSDDGGRSAEEIDALFPHSSGRFTFEDLVRYTGLDSAELTIRLWELAWEGAVTTDSFAPIRQGAGAGFAASGPASQRSTDRRGRRARFDRWRRERPLVGAWFALPAKVSSDDPLVEDEDDRERARIVLDRYGVVFRALLEREIPDLRWHRLFRAFRLLELSGEVVAGHFISDVHGLQFASHTAIRRIREGLDDERVWWINAVDPASPCGLGLEVDDWLLPRRVPGNHLVFHGHELMVVSERRGSVLTVSVAPDHPKLHEYFSFLGHLLTRSVQPRRRIDVATVNGEAATASPYRPALERLFQVTRQPSALRLSRKY